MKVIGLTGSFGTGKTFTASIFKSFGAKIIDADKIAHDVIARGSNVYKKIVAAFGASILDKWGNINRARLAALAFSKKTSIKKLNDIVHPEVVKLIIDEIRRAAPDDVVVIDAPLLIEANLHNIVNELVVVKASKERQIERCTKKLGIKKDDMLKRIKYQMPLAEKIELADFVIDNNGTKAETKKQVSKVWREIVWK